MKNRIKMIVIFLLVMFLSGVVSGCSNDGGSGESKDPDLPGYAVPLNEANSNDIQEIAIIVSNALSDLEYEIYFINDCYEFSGNPDVDVLKWSGRVTINNCSMDQYSFSLFGSSPSLEGKLTSSFEETDSKYKFRMEGGITITSVDSVVEVNQITYSSEWVDKGNEETETVIFKYAFSITDYGGFVVVTSKPLKRYEDWDNRIFTSDGELLVKGLNNTKMKFSHSEGEYNTNVIYLDKLGDGNFELCSTC